MTKIYLGNQPVYDPLVLPNNSRINGVEHFYQTTKPIARGDSSALVIGDRWWKTDDGTEWFWNGTYWLSQEKKVASHDQANSFGTFTTLTVASHAQGSFLPLKPLFIENIYWNQLNSWRLGDNTTSCNVYIGLARPQQVMASNGIVLHQRDVVTTPFSSETIPVNLFVSESVGRKLQVELLAVGSTSPNNGSYWGFSVDYREVYP